MGSLVCRVVMSKTEGVTVTVENADGPNGKITQTVTMDGTTLTLKVAGEQETSTFTQKAESIHVKCKEFKLDAETITCTSEKDSQWTSKGKLTVESTQDMSLKSSAKFDLQATAAAKVKAASVEVKADTDVKLEGVNFTAKGSAGAKLQGAQVEIKGDAQVGIKAPMIEAKADGMLTAEASGIATLKGAGMAKVEGGMVKLG